MYLNVIPLSMHTAFSVERRTQGEELESKCADILINDAQDQRSSCKGGKTSINQVKLNVFSL